jgi:hypothetical protein
LACNNNGGPGSGSGSGSADHASSGYGPRRVQIGNFGGVFVGSAER